MPDHNYFSNLIWQIADLLRGPYRPPQYERVMLPMTVLRRFDCVLAPTKAKVLAEFERRKGGRLEGDALDTHLNNAAGQRFHNHSPLDFERLKGDPDNIEKHLVSYIKGFSKNVRDIFEFFEFEAEIERMREANILYLVVSKFCDVDLHPSAVPNEQMGLIFENLIRRFNELANETAGDHFTPREVIRLMVSILFMNDDDRMLQTPGTVRKLLDPACGTGGMLAEAQNYLREHHGAAKLYVYGQDYNKRAFATAASDMLMKQVDHNGAGNNVRYGDSFTEDQFAGETFDYFLTNPPFGVDWKKQQKEIQQERDKRGFDGRFGAGLPRVNDGSLLFLQHMVASSSPCARRSTSTARGWPSSSAARRCSPAARARARATSASGSSRTTGSRPSSPCRSRCSTTPASAPTSGSSPTARTQRRKGKIQLLDARERVGRGRQRGQQAQPRRQAPAHHE
jgi:type I restriction enzyme M protein